jgi:Common central domain of tyrosinase/von Willebrand factor type A domain
MALGDGIRRNIATVSVAERDLFIDAIIQLHTNPVYVYPGGVTYWFKQDEVHQATHVHGGAAFLPWHRELCNRFEELIRLVHPELSLHYWDWKTDPIALFTNTFMGNAHGQALEPWESKGFYDNSPNPADFFRADDPFDAAHSDPKAPPLNLTRNVGGGALPTLPDENIIYGQNQYPEMRSDDPFIKGLEFWHNNIHGYIGGSIGNGHTSFRDPFVFLIHSNIDRVFAQWQMNNNAFGNEWRLNPEDVYGSETNDSEILESLEPWAGGKGTRPWTVGDGQIVVKNSKHPSVVKPTCYDTIQALIEYQSLNIDFGSIPEGLTSYRAAKIKVKSCHKVKFKITQNPTGNFGLTAMGDAGLIFTYDPHISGEYGDAFVWIQFTANGAGLQTTTIKVQAFEDTDPVNPHNIGAEQTITFTATPLPRINNSIALVLDRSGSMSANAGGSSTRTSLLKSAVGVFATLMRTTDEIGIVSFDDVAATLLSMTPQSAGLVQVITLLVGNLLDPRGSTGIGLGIQQGNAVLAGGNPAFNKAMLVLTDGNENVHPFINELSPGTVSNKTFAIGFGLPADVSTTVLNQITHNTNGDLVVTGNITTEEQRFLLTKYFVQVLNGINNNQVILDPQGNLLWGAVHKIPFTVSETDISLECIALCPVPLLLSFKLETPEGKIIDPAMSGIEPNINYVDGKEVAFYRIMLPALPGEAPRSHAGKWNAILQIKSKEEIELLVRKKQINLREITASLKGTLPYNFMAQCYSNLTFTAKSIQTSFEPGAIITLDATLKEYDQPIAKRAKVIAEVTKPDNSTSIINLHETELGIFETEYKTKTSGNYTFRLIASGMTMQGNAFTREKTVTAGVFFGGDKYDNNNSSTTLINWLTERDKRMCELLNCIFSGNVMDERFEKRMIELGIDLKQLRECLKRYCSQHGQKVSKTEKMKVEKALKDFNVADSFDKLNADFMFTNYSIINILEWLVNFVLIIYSTRTNPQLIFAEYLETPLLQKLLPSAFK